MLLPAHNLSGYVSYINGEYPIHMGWAFILDTAFYPTPRSLGLLFNVVRPSYLSDIWYHVSVWNCTTSYPNLLLTHTGSGRIQAPQGMVRKHIPPFTYK